jgi:hypothetical protein
MEGMGLGRKIVGKAYRDAIHIAVAPAMAAEKLKRGDYIVPVGDGSFRKAKNEWEGIAIVDPFLLSSIAVEKGEQFWMFLRPLTITSIRHVWSHPAVPNVAGVSADPDYEILAGVASVCGKSYSALIADMTEFAGQKPANIGGMPWREHIVDNSERYKEVDVEQWNAAWAAWERITGRVAPEDRDEPYSCAC